MRQNETNLYHHIDLDDDDSLHSNRASSHGSDHTASRHNSANHNSHQFASANYNHVKFSGGDGAHQNSHFLAIHAYLNFHSGGRNANKYSSQLT